MISIKALKELIVATDPDVISVASTVALDAEQRPHQAVFIVNGQGPIKLFQQCQADVEDLRFCRVCGCHDDDCSECIERTGQPCHWVEEDLCSACSKKENAAIECSHSRLDEDGICRVCGADRRGIG